MTKKKEKAAELISVDSNLIDGYSWKVTKEVGDLVIKFVHGESYLYKDVDADTVDGFLDAESKGSYFSTYIKNSFMFEKIDELAPKKAVKAVKASPVAKRGTPTWPFPTGNKV